MKRSSERLISLLRRLNPSPGYRQRETAGQTKPVCPGTDRPQVTLASVVAESHEDPQDVPEQQRHPGKLIENNRLDTTQCYFTYATGGIATFHMTTIARHARPVVDA